MNMVELKAVSKTFGNVSALSAIDLNVKKGEFVTLLGPSGSGKTTLLNIISGMLPPSSGQVFINGKEVTNTAPGERQIGMVFQNYALMPHMTAFDNVAFPLRVRRVPVAEIQRRVDEALRLVQLPDVAQRRPRELSGGQQQRIALARCIVYQPSLILLDEPLGALDKKLREYMQVEIRRLHEQLETTMLNVTHDQHEALTMSDRIVLMNQGRIEQIGSPEDLYFRPNSVFVADFIGSANLIPATATSASDDRLLVNTPFGAVKVTGPRSASRKNGNVTLLVRPENIRMIAVNQTDTTRTEGTTGVFSGSIVLGSSVRHLVRVGAIQFMVEEPNNPDRLVFSTDSPVRLCWAPSECQVL